MKKNDVEILQPVNSAGELAKRLKRSGYRPVELVALALNEDWIELAEVISEEKAQVLVDFWPQVLERLAKARRCTCTRNLNGGAQ